MKEENNSLWLMKQSSICLVLALFAAVNASAKETEGFGGMVVEFSRIRHEQMKELAKDLNLKVPEAAGKFMAAAEKGDWPAVSNLFSELKEPDGLSAIPELRNELWAPIHETLGAYEEWDEWKNNTELMELFYNSVVNSMPTGAVYFGGTDYGRFLVTTACDVMEKPPVYCITQNALADNSYAKYLMARYGDEIWIPDAKDCAGAFQKYITEVQSGLRKQNAELQVRDGRVQVSGALGVMEINGIICEMIHEHNRDKHPFFVEESYVIDWMYPYLEPHGLIMKLNKEKMQELSAETVKRDGTFWEGFTSKLMSRPDFKDNPEARKAFSKMRCAIAGIYKYRKLYDEAEAAFRQALQLCPESPEGSYRLAAMLEETGKVDAAADVIKKFIAVVPAEEKGKAQAYLDRLEKGHTPAVAVSQEIESAIRDLGDSKASVRAEARRKLEKMGAAAGPALEKHKNAEDLETRMSVKELLDKLNPPIPDKARDIRIHRHVMGPMQQIDL